MSAKELIIGWGVGGLLLLVFVWLSVLNAGVFWKLYVRKVPAPSWIPLVGGICGAFGLMFIPVGVAHKWCWLPLILDCGTVPGLVYTTIFYLIHFTRRRG